MKESDLRQLSVHELLREISRQAAFATNTTCYIPGLDPTTYTEPLIEFGDFIVLPRFPDKTDRPCP